MTVVTVILRPSTDQSKRLYNLRQGGLLSPQRSNREHLIDGTIRCLERLAPEQITVRAIAAESGANVASITYHFGSKDNLMTEAVVVGLDRWLVDIAEGLGDLASLAPLARFQRAAEVIEHSRWQHTGLARNFLGALAKAQHDPRIAELLTEGFQHTRVNVADLLGLGDDQAGRDAGGLVVALFNGLLFQSLVNPSLAIEGDRFAQAQIRLIRALPKQPA